MKVAVVIPVSPFEDWNTIEKSIKHIKSLDYTGIDVKFVYVIDKNSKNDNRGVLAKKLGVCVVEREGRRGKRGGAINEAIKKLEKFSPDYIAIFDVDTRPERNFILECIKALEKCKECYIASSKRYIANGINFVSETVEVEYYLLNFLLSKSSFKQFNGLIGVLRADVLMKERLSEEVITEDADFATRMHAAGMRALLVTSTKLYEDAPMSWKELFEQRKRWYYGGLQLWRYRFRMKKLKFRVRLSWYLALSLTYIIFLFSPLLILAPPPILLHYKKISKLKVVFGLFIHSFILQIAAASAFVDFISGKKVKWGKIRRASEVVS